VTSKEAKPTREEMDVLAVQLLREFWLVTVNAFIDAAGEKKVFQTNLPYLKPFGMSEAIEIEQVGLIQADSLAGQMQTLALSLSILDIQFRPVELRRDGGFIEITDCPMKGVPRVFCSLHEEICRGMLAARHQDLELTNLGTREAEKKTCRWLIFDREKGQDLVNGEKAISTVETPAISEELRLDRAMMSLTESWVTTLDAMVDSLGQEKAELVLAPRFRAIGAAHAQRFLQFSGARTKDLQSIAQAVDKFNEVLYQEGDLMQTCDGQPVKVMSSCPFSGTNDLACALLESVVKGICQELDENTDCRFIKFECRNNVVCHWALFKRPRPTWPMKDQAKQAGK